MNEEQYKKFLRDNVKPLSIVGSKIKLELCPLNYLTPNKNYYTKCYDGTIIKWEYLPSSKSYRKDLSKLVSKNLIYVEKTEELVIFRHNNEQLKMFK